MDDGTCCPSVLTDGLAAYYVSCFLWAEEMIEEVDCPSRFFFPLDLGFFDMLQSKDKVNTFGVKNGVRDVLLFLQLGLL